MNQTTIPLKKISLITMGLFSLPTVVNASGYHFGTQSVSAQATANASAAEAADASTIYYNAAGISKLNGTNISINANLVAPSVKYNNATASYFEGDPVNKPTTPATGGKISKDIVAVPHLYAAHELNDKWSVGLGVYVPFASETEYQRDSVLRYNVNKMGLTAIDINPTVAYKINDNHSIAVGLLAQHASAELRQYANLGAFKGANGAADGYATVEGDDWGLGYTLSYLWDVDDSFRLGINYRSKVKHNLKGTAKWQSDTPTGKAVLGGIRQQFAALGLGPTYAAEEKASVEIVTPESLSIHGKLGINDRWTAFGDVTWTRHSRFNKVNINYENIKPVKNANHKTPTPFALSKTTVLKPNWRDTFKIGLGAAYQYNDDLQLRFGVAYDQSPVKSADYRMTTLPDNDRIWLSFGAKYEFSENSSINLGYSYIHIKNAKANVNGWCGGAKGQYNCVSSQTDGTTDYKSHAHILGIQYNHRF